MKIKITNKVLEFIASLKRKNDKQKAKMVKSLIGKNKNIEKIFNIDIDDSNLSRDDKILYNIREGFARQKDLMPGIEIDFRAKNKVRKLNIFKRFIRLFNKKAFAKEFNKIQRQNKDYKSFIIAAKSAFSNYPEETEELLLAEEAKDSNSKESTIDNNKEENRKNIEVVEDNDSLYDEEDKTYIEDDMIINPNNDNELNANKELE